MNNQTLSIHESLPIGIILAIAGGAMDTFTYILHGQTFATMQSANVLLLGINIAQGNLAVALTYIAPVLSFIIGTMLVEEFKLRFGLLTKRIVWQQIILVIEIILLISIALLTSAPQILVNTTISFVAALQVGTYRTLSGVPFSTTMTTGNIRTAAEHFYYRLKHKDKEHGNKSKNSFIITFAFFLGALISAFLYFNLNIQPIWTSIIALIIVLIVSFFDEYYQGENK